METSFGLLFFLRKPKKFDQSKPVPVYLRITVDKVAVELSLKRQCYHYIWCAAAGRQKAKTVGAKEFNGYLDTIEQKVYEVKRRLIEKDEVITAVRIKQLMLGTEAEKQKRTILQVFRLHNEQMEKLVGAEFADGTLERYKTSYDHTQRFIRHYYQQDDLPIDKLDYEFIEQYGFWLKTERHCSHNTTMKYLGNFKKIVNICVAKRWLQGDPFFGFKKTIKKVQKVALTDEELTTMANKSFTNLRLGVVRDIFLFSCFTGLAYADVKKLKVKDLFIGIDGHQWLACKRQKVDTSSRLPLLPVAERLVSKYCNRHIAAPETNVFPVRTNQKMNEYLKEIADLCGITKTLTYHIARHTFATTVTLLNRVPIETVSRMLAHEKITTTQLYAQVLDIKISEEMKGLREKYL